MSTSTTTQNPHIYELRQAAKIAIICGYSRREFLQMAKLAIAETAIERFKTKKAAASELKCKRDTLFWKGK